MKFLKTHLPLLLIAVVLFSIPSKAQVLSTKNISLDAAKKIVAEAVVYAKANNAPGSAIAVVDAGGNLVYLERLDNTFAAASPAFWRVTSNEALQFRLGFSQHTVANMFVTSSVTAPFSEHVDEMR